MLFFLRFGGLLLIIDFDVREMINAIRDPRICLNILCSGFNDGKVSPDCIPTYFIDIFLNDLQQLI